MEQFEIHATVRRTRGNSPARVLRRSGQMPAVLYGPKTEPVLLSVNVKEFEQILKKGNIGSIILNLVIQNGKKVTKPAMIKELQSHPVSGNFLHVDFYEIDMQRKIYVMIPIIAKGKAKGVENGGLLQIVRRELAHITAQTPDFDFEDVDGVFHPLVDFGHHISLWELQFLNILLKQEALLTTDYMTMNFRSRYSKFIN